MEYLVEIISGLIVAVPLVVALIKYIIKSVKEKNYVLLVQLAIKLISEAEEKFDCGAEKADYVTAMLKTAADEIGYEISEEQIRNLIEQLIGLTKKVNV